jgi:DNA-binding phage protein
MEDYVDRLEAEISNLKAENERLKNELGNWRYELAYCSMEEMPTDSEAVIPTPKGVKKFIDELLEEKTRLKHILTARHIKFKEVSVEEMEKVIEPLIHEVFETDDTSVLAQALFDRIYGKGEVKIDEIAKLKQALKREHMWVLHYKKLWEDTFIDKDPELKDKPKEYSEALYNEKGELVKCAKPIKTEKIEPKEKEIKMKEQQIGLGQREPFVSPKSLNNWLTKEARTRLIECFIDQHIKDAEADGEVETSLRCNLHNGSKGYTYYSDTELIAQALFWQFGEDFEFQNPQI